MTASLSAVSRSYGSTVALHPLDLTLTPGVVGLLGPNGAGKSTLLRMLATIQSPSAGTIRVAGHDVTGSYADRVAARRTIGYLPQEVVFPRGMTAFGFLDYVAVLKEWDDTRARHGEVLRVLDLVALGDRTRSRIRTLSGGQRRRLGIAQAMIGAPQLLILDEPTTGLDPEQRAGLRALVSDQQGTVLLSTHQTEDVSALCDRVIVLDTGRVRFDGTVPELLAAAEGCVHEGDRPTPGASQSWRTGSGRIRSVGGVPGAGFDPVAPTVEDAYLLLRSPAAEVAR
ncbi:MAG: ABC transporter ATP-binding protein [Nocardioides sp.]|uniref:ABC transporter ATP-binding protein n=1 Tax=Nocardioides sp. TaxID=35761 RepID=UPI003EFE5632